MLALEASISRLEAAIGVGPESRLKLGVAVLGSYQTLADFNRPYLEGNFVETEDDPRLEMVRLQTERKRP